MELELIRQQLHKRYIEPTKVKREKYIGVEIEMSIVNLSKNAVEFEVIHEITNRFISHFKFTVVGTDDDGNIYSATVFVLRHFTSDLRKGLKSLQNCLTMTAYFIITAIMRAN